MEDQLNLNVQTPEPGSLRMLCEGPIVLGGLVAHKQLAQPARLQCFTEVFFRPPFAAGGRFQFGVALPERLELANAPAALDWTLGILGTTNEER